MLRNETGRDLGPFTAMLVPGQTSQETKYKETLSSVQFSCSVMSDSLWPHELQHARPPCPSPTPGIYSNSCPSSQWCHPAISSSVVPFSSCPQSLPASGSFPMSQLCMRWPKFWSFSFSIRNPRGLKITAWMQSWGKFLTKDKKDRKNPTATSEKLGKVKCQEQNQGIAHNPCTQYHLRGGQTT